MSDVDNNDKIFLNKIKKINFNFENGENKRIEEALNKIKTLIEERSEEGFMDVYFLITGHNCYLDEPDNDLHLRSPDTILTINPPLNGNHIRILKKKLIELGFWVSIRTDIEAYNEKNGYDFFYGHSMKIDWSGSLSSMFCQIL